MFMVLLLKYWKFAVIGLLIIGATYWHQRAVTRAYERGAIEKQEEMLKTEAARIEEQTALSRVQMDVERKEIEAMREAVVSDRLALNTQRRTLTAELSRGLAAIAGREVDLRNAIPQILDADVNARFRDALLRARAAERDRAAGRIIAADGR